MDKLINSKSFGATERRRKSAPERMCGAYVPADESRQRQSSAVSTHARTMALEFGSGGNWPLENVGKKEGTVTLRNRVNCR